MALRFVDGFDWKSNGSDLTTKYDTDSATNGIVSAQTARYGSGIAASTNADAQMYKTLNSQGTWIVGIALKQTNASGNWVICSFLDGGTAQVTISRIGDTIRVYRGAAGGTTLGTTATVFTLNTWAYFEFKVVFHNSAGTVDIMKDGVSVLSLSAQDTTNTANATADEIQFGPCGTNCHRDDVYVCDGTGATNNDFLGDVRVETIFPNGNGNSSQFTGSDGNSTDNYLLVDETNPDNDTTYVQSTTLNHIDLYAMGNLANTPVNIYGVAVNVLAKKTDVDSRSLTEKVRSSATNYSGGTIALGADYRMLQSIRETDPATAAAWTASGVNAMEAGYEVTT